MEQKIETKNNKPKREWNPQEYQLILQVLGKTKDKVYGGDWAGRHYYRLKVKIAKPAEFKKIKEILAFQDRIQDEQIWAEILADDYFDRRKLAICSKHSSWKTKKTSLNLLSWRDRPVNHHQPKSTDKESREKPKTK